MKNSIEEDIKNAEHFIKSIKTDKEYKEENGWHGYYNKEIVELARMLDHILSDYKRVLKENKKLKEVRKWYFENTVSKILRDDYVPKSKIKDKIKLNYKKVTNLEIQYKKALPRNREKIREDLTKLDGMCMAYIELIKEF